MLTVKHKMPVKSGLVLLRPEANQPDFTGEILHSLPGETPYLTFRYDVVKLWEMPVETLLNSGIGTLPLAPLANLGSMPIEAVIEKMKSQVQYEDDQNEVNSFWASAYIMMGMKYSKEAIDTLLKGVMGMKDSVTYKAILEEGLMKGKEEGKADEARRILLNIGTNRYGVASDETRKRIEATTSLVKLEFYIENLFRAENWIELFDQS